MWASSLSPRSSLNRFILGSLLSLVAHLSLFGFFIWMLPSHELAQVHLAKFPALTVRVISHHPRAQQLTLRDNQRISPIINRESRNLTRRPSSQAAPPRSGPRSRHKPEQRASRGSDKNRISTGPSKTHTNAQRILTRRAETNETVGPVSLAESGAKTRAKEAEYLSDLMTAVAGQKFYPEKARRAGREGRVVVSLSVHRDGKITRIDVAEPSGSRLLDRAAQMAVRQVGHFRPFSNDITSQVLNAKVAFTYRLDG